MPLDAGDDRARLGTDADRQHQQAVGLGVRFGRGDLARAQLQLGEVVDGDGLLVLERRLRRGDRRLERSLERVEIDPRKEGLAGGGSDKGR